MKNQKQVLLMEKKLMSYLALHTSSSRRVFFFSGDSDSDMVIILYFESNNFKTEWINAAYTKRIQFNTVKNPSEKKRNDQNKNMGFAICTTPRYLVHERFITNESR